MQLEDFN